MALRTLLDLALPPACAACGRAGAVVCRACLATFTPPERGDFVTADARVALGGALAVAIGAFAFDGTLRRALGRLKYAGAARASEPLAVAAAPALRRLLVVAGPGALLVPVPLHAARRRERGYNQAELLARVLGRATGVAVTDVLERREATQRQHRLDRAARLRNLQGAIRVRPSAAVPRVPVVVDDILTTSATLEACAAVLRVAGAEVVYGFTIAREV